jgi:hypothetical protein
MNPLEPSGRQSLSGHEPKSTDSTSAVLRILVVLSILAVSVLAPTVAAAKGNDLRGASVSPRSGTTSTIFHLAVTLHDDDSHGKVVIVRIGGVEYPMVRSACGRCDGHQDARYTFAGTLPLGTYDVSFVSESKGKHGSDSLRAGSIKVSAPKSTPKPVATPKPVKTPKPKATTKPAKVAKPGNTAKPDRAPKPTPKPVKTPKPTPGPADVTKSVAVAVGRPQASPTPKPPARQAATGRALGAASVLQIGLGQDAGQQMILDDVRLTSAFSTYAWLVPGFALGLPGLFVLLMIGLQLVGATFFVPLTRRLLAGKAAPRIDGRSGAQKKW